jgi:hypothetical protein
MNLAMLSANRGGKSHGLSNVENKKRRLPEGKAAFCYNHDTQRGIALSLAGLAATYSPRA